MLKNLEDIQLHRLIQKGKNVEACKEVWKRRWGIDYPFYKSANGIKRYGE